MSRPEARAEAQRGLQQAANDLAFAEHGLRLGFHAQACFLSQQAAAQRIVAFAREQSEAAA
jgi:HEPN domain-containing protein